MIFRPMTGNTQGIRLRISPPNNMPPRTGRNLENGSDDGRWRSGCGGRCAVSGTATGRAPVRMPENESPCGMSFSSASLVARFSRISQASPSRLIEPPELADCTKGWSGTKSTGSFSKAPAGFTRSRMSSPAGLAVNFQSGRFSPAGWRGLFQTAPAAAGSFSGVAATGSVEGEGFLLVDAAFLADLPRGIGGESHCFPRPPAWRAR